MMINDVCSGDDFSHRLLLSVQNVLKEPVLAYKPIKEGKWKIFLPSGPWFLKEFSSETKWKQQQALIRSLHSVHFFKTAEPHPMQNGRSHLLSKTILWCFPMDRIIHSPFFL